MATWGECGVLCLPWYILHNMLNIYLYMLIGTLIRIKLNTTIVIGQIPINTWTHRKRKGKRYNRLSHREIKQIYCNIIQ